jgi:hypothetical protein
MLDTNVHPGVDDPEIQEAIAATEWPKGQRSEAILLVMNSAGQSGWTNHDILKLGSALAVRWGVTDPETNVYEHWTKLLQKLRNVRSHYPAPEPTQRAAAEMTAPPHPVDQRSTA